MAHKLTVPIGTYVLLPQSLAGGCPSACRHQLALPQWLREAP